MAINQPSLKGRALRLLSGREHSRAELERKLASFEEEIWRAASGRADRCPSNAFFGHAGFLY